MAKQTTTQQNYEGQTIHKANFGVLQVLTHPSIDTEQNFMFRV